MTKIPRFGACRCESNPTSKGLYIAISPRARTILLIGVAALTLFVVGPLAGSIDDDGDGSPDLPVVVSVLASDFSPGANLDQRLANTHQEATAGQLSLPVPSRTVVHFQVSLVASNSVLHSCCSLRC